MNRRRFGFASAAVVLLLGALSGAQAAEDKLQLLNQIAQPDVREWRYIPGDLPNGSYSALDTSSWKTGDPEFEWGQQPTAWIRTRITIPERVGGVSVAGQPVTFKCGVDDDGILYVNGREVQKFHWDGGSVVLTESARPGEVFDIAIKGINTGGPGRLLFARLHYGVLGKVTEAVEDYLRRYRYAQDLCGTADEKSRRKYTPILAQSVSVLNTQALEAGDTDSFIASVSAAADKLEPVKELTKGITVHMVGHAHIDMNWLWLWPETVDVCKNTFSTMLRLMNDYPFSFTQSQASVYLAMQENDPRVFEGIRQAIPRGRWDPVVSTWTEGDNNMTSGEGIVRSILYGKRYVKQQFGTESTVGWFPDNFGHPWTLPQILAKSGIKYYYFMRCGNGHPLFWWQSPDGSRVLAFNRGSYNQNVTQDVGLDAVDFVSKAGVRDYMHVYGVGDHGGGPTKEMLENARELSTRKEFPTVEYTSVADFFDSALKQRQDFPVWNNELNTIFEGCYTTHADVKRWNRDSENLLTTAEAFSSIASIWGVPYPAKPFERSWRDTCFNQFHDILCGSAIHGSYDYSRQLYKSATAQGKSAVDAALRGLVGRIDTRGGGLPIVVFNPLGWSRTEPVSVVSPFAGQDTAVKITDSDGKSYAARNIGDVLYFTARNVPPLGYRVFWANRIAKPLESGIRSEGTTVENQYFRVSVDPKRGLVTSIYDKSAGREVLPNGARAGLLQILLEKPHGMSAWSIGEIAGSEDLTGDSEVVLTDCGPAKATISFDHRYGKSQFTQEIALYDDVPRIDLRITADWQEIGGGDKLSPMLKCAFPTGLKDARASFDIPFGHIERPASGAEVPAQKWIDLSTGDYGVSLLNNCKYGFDVKDGVMRVTLLRSSYEPDPIPDQGVHEVTLSLYPHKGDWRTARTVRRGYELNNPLVARVAELHPGELPRSRSFVSVSAPNVVVTTLKRAEDDAELLLRFYETDGKACRVTVNTALPAVSAVETDLMENPTGKPTAISGGEFTVDVGKYEIKTYKLLSK